MPTLASVTFRIVFICRDGVIKVLNIRRRFILHPRVLCYTDYHCGRGSMVLVSWTMEYNVVAQIRQQMSVWESFDCRSVVEFPPLLNHFGWAGGGRGNVKRIFS